MQRKSSGTRVTWTVLLLSILVGCAGAQTGQVTQTPAPENAGPVLHEAMSAFWNLEYGKAEKLAQSVVSMPAVGKADLAEAQKVLACVYTMRRSQRDALEALVRMFEIDQTARFSPDANYPPPVIKTYYTVRDSLFPGTMDIRTVAVGDFENNSVFTGKFKQYDFGALEKALPHLIMLDLVNAAGLKVVDRQRTGEILKELQISTSGFADPKEAVQAGKLLGAHAFIFGQYMLLSADKVRIDARVVKTATGEVLAAKEVTGDFSGKPEVFFELQRELISGLMATLEEALGPESIPESEKLASRYYEGRKKGVQARAGYVDGVFLTAAALDAEEGGDYKSAVERWKQVLEADPANDVAATRVKILTPLVG